MRYGVARDSERVELEAVAALARAHKPKMIVAGGSAYARALDFAGLRAIADEVGALLMVDMAHFAGLVATGLYPHPFPHAHIVTSTTYKSLRGARGGLVLWNDAALSDRINYGIFPGVQGSVMMHAVAAKAACFGEALRPEFRAYNQAVLDNARALAESVAASGMRLVAGGTDCGLMLVDLSPQGVTGDVAARALEAAGLAVNKNQIPFDTRPPEAPSGLRLSSNAGTARGFGAQEFRQVGRWIARVVAAPHDAAGLAAIRERGAGPVPAVSDLRRVSVRPVHHPADQVAPEQELGSEIGADQGLHRHRPASALRLGAARRHRLGAVDGAEADPRAALGLRERPRSGPITVAILG